MNLESRYNMRIDKCSWMQTRLKKKGHVRAGRSWSELIDCHRLTPDYIRDNDNDDKRREEKHRWSVRKLRWYRVPSCSEPSHSEQSEGVVRAVRDIEWECDASKVDCGPRLCLALCLTLHNESTQRGVSGDTVLAKKKRRKKERGKVGEKWSVYFTTSRHGWIIVSIHERFSLHYR